MRAPGDHARHDALEEGAQGAGKGGESADVHEVAVPGGDEAGAEAHHRTAEEPRRDHAHGPQIGVGMKDVVAGVGAEDAEHAEKHRDAGRGPGRSGPTEIHPFEGRQRHDGESAGQKQPDALGQLQEKARHLGNEHVQIHAVTRYKPSRSLKPATRLRLTVTSVRSGSSITRRYLPPIHGDSSAMRSRLTSTARLARKKD